MKDQHKKITGYRDLSQGEIDLMNEGKELAEQCGKFIERLESTGSMEPDIAKSNIQSVIDVIKLQQKRIEELEDAIRAIHCTEESYDTEQNVLGEIYEICRKVEQHD